MVQTLEKTSHKQVKSVSTLASDFCSGNIATSLQIAEGKAIKLSKLRKDISDEVVEIDISNLEEVFQEKHGWQ